MAAEETLEHRARDTRHVNAGPLQATLLLPEEDPPRALVLLLPDRLGHDPRSAPYIDQLLRAGFAALDILRGGDDARIVADAVARLPGGFRWGRTPIAVIGFGAGARVALQLPQGIAARVLLYPGCDGWTQAAPPPGVPTLLLHGGADPANAEEACAGLARRLGGGEIVRLVTYRDAGYAWDYPAYGLSRRALLPRPDGRGRVAADIWPELASMSAAQAADFLAIAIRRAAQ